MRTKYLPKSILSAVIAALIASTVAVAAPDSTTRSRYLYFHVKSPVPRGELAHVVVQGRTGLCRITVSKRGAQMKLGSRTAGNPLAPISSKRVDDNRIAWQWTVPASSPLGQWHVRVTCGREAPLQGTFLVTA